MRVSRHLLFRAVLAALLTAAAASIVLHVLGHRAPLRQNAAKVLVLKTEHKLLLLDTNGHVIQTYAIAIGRGGVDAKERRGDHRTPEGLYSVDWRKKESRFHRALHVSYPNDADRERALRLSVEPGGDVMIHGIQNGLGWLGVLHRVLDWTDGCIAVSDSEIEEIWFAVPDGTPVEIRH